MFLLPKKFILVKNISFERDIFIFSYIYQNNNEMASGFPPTSDQIPKTSRKIPSTSGFSEWLLSSHVRLHGKIVQCEPNFIAMVAGA